MRAVADTENTEDPAESPAEDAGDGAFGGGMIALIPSEGDAALLAVEGGDDLDELHLTLTYLGPDVEQLDEAARAAIVDAAGKVAAASEPITARVFAHATFNPDGYQDREPCAVYLIGDTDALGPLKEQLDKYASAEQHEPYYPHVTAGYGLSAADLSYTGAVTFDVLRVAIGEANIIIPLGDVEQEEDDDDDTDRTGDEPAGDDGSGNGHDTA